MKIITLHETLKLIHEDLNRRLTLEQKKPNWWLRLLITPRRGVVSVIIYRIKRYLHFKNNILAKLVIRLLKFPEFHYCHNELDPRAEIGPGLVLSDLGGVGLGLSVVIGKNCTFMGKGTPTLGAMEGVNLHIDKIIIGDFCVFGHNAKIINAVTVADCVQLAPHAVLMSHVKVPGSLIAGYPAKTIDVVQTEQVKAWSPLLSRFIYTVE